MRLEIMNAKLPLQNDTDRYHLIAEDGKWIQISKQNTLWSASFLTSSEQANATQVRRIDAGNRIVLPGLVDGHVHLDKAHTLAIAGNESGTLMEAIQNYREQAPGISKENVKQRMKRTVLDSAAFGTTAMRTHLDFFTADDGTVAKRTIEAALEVKKEVQDIMDLQLYIMSDPVTLDDSFKGLLQEGLAAGIDGIGGAPHLSLDFQASVRALFEFSEKTGKPLDLHSDETDDPSVNTVSMIATEVLNRGMEHQVTVGHLCSLSAMDQAKADQTMHVIKDAGIHVMTLPGANMYLQGRSDRGLIRRGVTRVKELHELGVNVAVASDNIQDPFHPFGQGDLLEIARLSTYAAHMNSESDRLNTLAMITEHPAKALGYHSGTYGFSEGAPANCVVTNNETVSGLLADLSPDRLVIRSGRLLSKTKRSVHWFDASDCHVHSDDEHTKN
ncbi:amidohydrolase family protein [Salisediminibacterium beveridgei]|uniref:Cytosine deaminase n=1 Tax=Salisediminibacterium beveridgei TaxID=632773 RepID=A0A1D7QYG7_9BACI|nr:amidohydrolase family protein [Salisediminibacterium beveridgei]AOM84039.1 Cytosine deaminase [Salisediminibacterium beveridgei]